MPNPIAHPAAAIPFTRAGLVFSALVFGSISPDFGYFVSLPGEYYSHRFPGLIFFDVPVAFILLLLYHAFLKWPLVAALPKSLQRRLITPARGFSYGPPKRFGLILLSLLVGSTTHVVWDSFTHDYGWMVEQFSIFRTPIGGIPLYTLLQWLSTLSGISLLTYWLTRWLPTAPQSDELPGGFSARVKALFVASGMSAVVAVEAIILYVRYLTGSQFWSWRFWMFSRIFSALVVIALFVGAYCLAWMIKFHKTILPAQ